MAARSGYWFAIVTVFAICAACTSPKQEESQTTNPAPKAVRFESSDLRVTLAAVIGVGKDRSLVTDPGWLEYVILIENLGRSDLVVENVKLLDRNRRYVDSASAYQQITTAPDASSVIAGTVARSTAGSVAGHFIPYGGSIVSVLSRAVAASAAEDEAEAQRLFARRALKNIELAPNGRVNGSAFLPKVKGAPTLVILYRVDEKLERLEMALPASMRYSE